LKVKFINDYQSANPRYKGFVHGVGQIIKEEGIRGPYQGLTATIMKEGTNQAMRFGAYETLKEWYRDGDPNKNVPKPMVGIFGLIGGAVSVFANTPIDVVKTRMQGLDANKYKNTFDCFVKIARYEGPKAFYKGMIPRLGRVCLEVPIRGPKIVAQVAQLPKIAVLLRNSNKTATGNRNSAATDT